MNIRNPELLGFFNAIMERTREVDSTSLAGSEVRSLSNFSMISHSSEPKNERNNGAEDNTGKMSLIIEAINETLAEQNARSKELAELLNASHVETKSLPKNIEEAWANVSAILRAEGLSRVDETALKIHMEQRRRDKMKKARVERKLKSRYDELCRRHGEILNKQSEIREATESLQKFVETEWSNNEEEYANRIFLATKLNDYRQTAKNIEESLKQRVTEDHYPDKILEIYEIYLKLVEESKSLDKALSKYEDLPPRLSEARIKVEEKEQHLKNLERALIDKMKS